MSDFIGQYEVIRLDGGLQLPRMRLAIESRAGVDGEAVYQAGVHGDVERLTTSVDVATWAQAELLYRQYVEYIGATVRIFRAGFAWNDVDYILLDVQKIRIANMLLAVGGLNGGYTLLRCAWDVKPERRL